jgi:hypothetical protein
VSFGMMILNYELETQKSWSPIDCDSNRVLCECDIGTLQVYQPIHLIRGFRNVRILYLILLSHNLQC